MEISDLEWAVIEVAPFKGEKQLADVEFYFDQDVASAAAHARTEGLDAGETTVYAVVKVRTVYRVGVVCDERN